MLGNVGKRDDAKPEQAVQRDRVHRAHGEKKISCAEQAAVTIRPAGRDDVLNVANARAMQEVVVNWRWSGAMWIGKGCQTRFQSAVQFCRRKFRRARQLEREAACSRPHAIARLQLTQQTVSVIDLTPKRDIAEPEDPPWTALRE